MGKVGDPGAGSVSEEERVWPLQSPALPLDGGTDRRWLQSRVGTAATLRMRRDVSGAPGKG